MTAPALAVLGFHRIGPPPPDRWATWFFIPTNTFEDQLAWLAASQWEIIDLDALVRGLADPGSLGERSVLLTFDDAHRSMREHALPVLERSGTPAVVFAPTDHVGARSADFDPWEPDEAICDWTDLAELERAGVRVEPHAASHTTFSELSAEERRKEIVRSKRAIEERLEKDVQALAYPYGDAGEDGSGVEADLMAAGYRVAFGYPGTTLHLPVEDPYRIPRVAMGPDTDLEAELARP